MIIHNVTFCADRSLADELLLWVREVYAPAAGACGLESMMLARVMGSPDPATESFALQLRAEGLGAVKSWMRGQGGRLTEDAARMWGDRVVLFPTNLQVL